MLTQDLLWVEWSELQGFLSSETGAIEWGGIVDWGESVNLIPDDLKEVRIISYSPGWADHYQSQICSLHGEDL